MNNKRGAESLYIHLDQNTAWRRWIIISVQVVLKSMLPFLEDRHRVERRARVTRSDGQPWEAEATRTYGENLEDTLSSFERNLILTSVIFSSIRDLQRPRNRFQQRTRL